MITINISDSIAKEVYTSINFNPNNVTPLLTDPTDISNFITEYFLKQIKNMVIEQRTTTANAQARTSVATQATVDFADIDSQISAIETGLKPKVTPPINQ